VFAVHVRVDRCTILPFATGGTVPLLSSSKRIAVGEFAKLWSFAEPGIEIDRNR
jgi:hypothetical protein